MDRTVTKQTLDGRTITISTVISNHVAWAIAVLNGKVVAEAGKPGVIPPIPGHPEFTHGLGKVALTELAAAGFPPADVDGCSDPDCPLCASGAK